MRLSAKWVRPRIGIVSNFDPVRDAYLCYAPYIRAVGAAGGLPLIVPYVNTELDIENLLSAVHGVVLVGGNDIEPELYGAGRDETVQPAIPERDAFELHLARVLLARDTPTLGICRGLHVLNVAAGGTLYTDIQTWVAGAGPHLGVLEHAAHPISVVWPSRLAVIVGRETIRVNSDHHQAVREPAAALRPVAHAPDGVIEALESPVHRFLVAVQWHPERIWEREETSASLLQSFIAASAEYSAEISRAPVSPRDERTRWGG